jgi:hypothetical protein
MATRVTILIQTPHTGIGTLFANSAVLMVIFRAINWYAPARLSDSHYIDPFDFAIVVSRSLRLCASISAQYVVGRASVIRARSSSYFWAIRQYPSGKRSFLLRSIYVPTRELRSSLPQHWYTCANRSPGKFFPVISRITANGPPYSSR